MVVNPTNALYRKWTQKAEKLLNEGRTYEYRKLMEKIEKSPQYTGEEWK